jgi:uncharacterized protein (TIGR02145 family)
MKRIKNVFLLAMVAMFVGACGGDEKKEPTDGEAIRMRIGKHDYLTYVYGEMRWMVENSREGICSGITYGRDANGNQTVGGGGDYDNLENGYYYASDQAPSACPEGWGLPTTSEVDELISRVYDDEDGDGRWWWWGDDGSQYGAFAGWKRGVTDGNRWNEWDMFGKWWVDTSTGVDKLLMGCSGYLAWDPRRFDDGTTWCSVRCVQRK